MKQLVILALVPVLLWAAVAYPSWLLAGDDALLHSGVALATCLVPALGTMLLVQLIGTTPEARMLAGMASSGIRMGVVLGIGFLLHMQLADRFPLAFLYWLLAFYLLTLGLEVTLLVKQ
jgi:hypothetical protein